MLFLFVFLNRLVIFGLWYVNVVQISFSLVSGNRVFLLCPFVEFLKHLHWYIVAFSYSLDGLPFFPLFVFVQR